MNNILKKKDLSRDDVIRLLSLTDKEELLQLYHHAREITRKHAGNQVSLRGIIELSNICKKDCYYCGIRAGNGKADRYFLNESAALEAAEYAWKRGFGSVVVQSGERQDKAFTNHITDLVRNIKKLSNNELGITLSCGEQSKEVYREWKEAGAHRYLLRIETSSEKLYHKLHPDNEMHSFEKRHQALKDLQELGYQTGTGVMIGFPFQDIEDLADDLLFMKDFSIDMAGMGPYIPHPDTPLYAMKNQIPSEEERLELSLKMIAVLRILMKEINIAASTALQTLDDYGRARAIAAGANVFMPNITPVEQASNYMIYKGKPLFHDMAETALANFEETVEDIGFRINYNSWGDSRHYHRRIAGK